MHRFPVSLPLLALLSMPLAALAAEPPMMGAPDCRIAPLAKLPAGEQLRWTGGCLDGYASGKGVLSWHGERGGLSIEGTLVRGEVSGTAVLKAPDYGYVYTGTLKSGVPDGQGYFSFVPSGHQYEGEVRNGRQHGKGESLSPDRSYYVGEWAEGKRNGWGEATYSTGGSYKGQWKDDRMHGQGTIVFAGSGRVYTGLFEDGRIAGVPKPEVDSSTHAITEKTLGSNIQAKRVVAYLPPNASWDQLSEAQKNTVRLHYPALEPGDDPPFPAKGERQLLDAIRKANTALGLNTGYLGVNVLVGKNGKPLSVTTFGAPSPELVRAVSSLAMLVDYKPAVCHGEPCEMVYPLRFNFTISK